MNIQDILKSQREFFNSQKTKDLSFRKAQLKKLGEVIRKNEPFLYEEIYKDFGKSKYDTFTTEISFILNDIEFYIKNLNSLAKPDHKATNIVNMPGNSRVYYDPLGCTLVIGAWNYPYQLSLSPMIAAMAAGNCCILKPSEVAEYTMKAMAKIINESFDSNYIFVAEGGVQESTEILKMKFDKIFFTGSTRVGQIVYEAAAKHLTPVTLELGGKSPTIVTANANLDVAAKRIVWGKFLNAGQTCVAPDYILADKKIESDLLEKLKFYIEKFKYQPESSHYMKIINERNFDRLTKLIDKEKVLLGGNYDREKRHIEPTVMKNVTWQDAVMQEEIFGPILPVLSFETLDEAFSQVEAHDKPLSAYLFTDKDDEKEKFTKRLCFGGGCINDVIMHFGNHNLPFGGVGASGIGNYHGKYGFYAFSHEKAMMDRATWGEPDLKYPPYTESKLNWVKKLL